MSRIGKKPIEIPQGVEVKLEGSLVRVKGPKGEITQEIRPEVKIVIAGNIVTASLETNTKTGRALWGLYRNLIMNMVNGVVSGFEKKLEVEGIGFKAAVEGDKVVLNVGFSHPVKIQIPEGIKVSVEKNVITVSGIRKDLVGQTAAIIKRVKKPEPYKGKGIRYFGEKIKKKLGKKAIASGG